MYIELNAAVGSAVFASASSIFWFNDPKLEMVLPFTASRSVVSVIESLLAAKSKVSVRKVVPVKSMLLFVPALSLSINEATTPSVAESFEWSLLALSAEAPTSKRLDTCVLTDLNFNAFATSDADPESAVAIGS